MTLLRPGDRRPLYSPSAMLFPIQHLIIYVTGDMPAPSIQANPPGLCKHLNTSFSLGSRIVIRSSSPAVEGSFAILPTARNSLGPQSLRLRAGSAREGCATTNGMFANIRG